MSQFHSLLPLTKVRSGLLALSFGSVVMFGHAAASQAAVFIAPTTVTPAVTGSFSVGNTFDNTINGNGLSNSALVVTGATVPALVTSGPTHTDLFTNNIGRFTHPTNDPNANGQGTSFTPAGVSLTFNLGGSYDLTGMWLWNYRESGGTNNNRYNRGIDSVLVEFSLDGTNWSPGQTLTPALSTTAGTAEALSFTGTLTGIQYVRFSNFSTHGAAENSNFFGFNEIRFTATAVPEPSITLLLGLGAVAFATRRRKSLTH